MWQKLKVKMLWVSLLLLVICMKIEDNVATCTNNENTYKHKITVYLAGQDSTVSDYSSSVSTKGRLGTGFKSVFR